MSTNQDPTVKLFEYLDKTDQNETARHASEIVIQSIHKASREENIQDPVVWLVALRVAQETMLKFMEEQR